MILKPDAVRPKEVELQYAWNCVGKNQIFLTENGYEIEVLYPGQWNVESGPDFLGARLKISGNIVAGDIEIHTYPTDWLAHGHSNDPKYKNVILHVVRHPCRSISSENKLSSIPLLIFSDEAIKSLLKTRGSARKYHPGLCSANLKDKSTASLSEYFSSIGERRLQNKTISLLSEIISIGAEASLIKRIFEACGYKNNKNEFLELYERYSSYDSTADPFAKEAILWGESGFLAQTDLANCDERLNQYVNTLWNAWWKLRKEHKTSEIKWVGGNVRFVNSPWRRIAGLITFLKKSNFNPMKTLLKLLQNPMNEDALLKEMIELFTVSEALLGGYLNFNAKVSQNSLLIGKARAIDIIGNVALPFIIAYGKLHDDASLQEKGRKLWSILPSSQSNISLKISAQRWLVKEQDIPKVFKAFSASQGAIYLYKNFCSFLAMDCSKCPKASC